VENQLAAASKVYGEKHPIVLELKAKKKAVEESVLARPKDEVKPSEGAALPADATKTAVAQAEGPHRHLAEVGGRTHVIGGVEVKRHPPRGSTHHFCTKI